MARVSVVIPIYNSSKYLRDSLDSILMQTYSDWELLAINEYGSNDGSAEIIQEYEQKDSRIHLIQNEEKLGLAESINKGIRLSEGEYIARLDADDKAHPKRLMKQVELMDCNRNVIVCGTYQHHFGINTNWVHKPAIDAAQCKANLLFFCDLCHSTLMLRKSAIEQNHLWYDNHFLAEDYELWTRVSRVGDIVNIPKVLGEYRVGEDNITNDKKERLNIESGQITLRSIKQNLGLVFDNEKAMLFQGWVNPFSPEIAGERRMELLQELESTLRLIYEANRNVRYYGDKELLRTLAAKWYWAKYYEPFNQLRSVNTIDEIFSENYYNGGIHRLIRFCKNNKGIRVKVRKLFSKGKEKLKLQQYKLNSYTREYLDRRIAEIENELELQTIKIENRLEEQTMEIERHINDMTWDRAVFVKSALENRIWRCEDKLFPALNSIYNFTTEEILEKNRIPYISNEKIRIVYLFQIPSCWPAFKSVWEIISMDERFDARLLLFDREQREKAQMNGARDFLIENGIAFENADMFDFLAFKPHIMIYQTPWDISHRPIYLRSDRINAIGTRIAYIPYGIEYSNSVWKDYRFSNNKLLVKPWKVYALSPAMKFEHYFQSEQGADHIVSTGLPKFDLLYHKENYCLAESIKAKIGNRKIVFWQMHFPALDGTPDYPEPDITEYLEFANNIDKYDECFFLVRMHPKFIESYLKMGYEEEANNFLKILSNKKNVYIYDDGDYMPALVNADGVIGDRSALMIEAIVLDVPVLYMTNFWYKEEMLDAVKPIYNSYYQGSKVYDMYRFIDLVMIKNIDYKKTERLNAKQECIPFFDGKCAERIVEDLVNSVKLN